MDELVGRDVHIPRAVFARHIAHEASREPPNGEHWVGKARHGDISKSQGAPRKGAQSTCRVLVT